MQFPITVKVCGITREADADIALTLGARYLGINLYQPSPRSVSPERAAELCRHLPAGSRVLVDVSPSTETLERYRDLGFDYFQLHCDPDTSLGVLAAWSGLVGAERLWIAPRLPAGEPFPVMLLAFAHTLVIDGYHPGSYGGTGKTSDWGAFRQLQSTHLDHTWVLAGGLSPAIIQRAIQESQARFVDVNSGVESAPGLKDADLLRALFEAIA